MRKNKVSRVERPRSCIARARTTPGAALPRRPFHDFRAGSVATARRTTARVPAGLTSRQGDRRGGGAMHSDASAQPPHGRTLADCKDRCAVRSLLSPNLASARAGDRPQGLTREVWSRQKCDIRVMLIGKTSRGVRGTWCIGAIRSPATIYGNRFIVLRFQCLYYYRTLHGRFL